MSCKKRVLPDLSLFVDEVDWGEEDHVHEPWQRSPRHGT